MLLEVSIGGYSDFYRDIERKKYCKKIARDVTIVSIDKMKDQDDEFRDKDTIADESIDIEFDIQRKLEIEELRKALLQLDDDEYKLIRALFFEKKTMREYAKTIGVHYATVHYRKKLIYEKLRKLLNF